MKSAFRRHRGLGKSSSVGERRRRRPVAPAAAHSAAVVPGPAEGRLEGLTAAAAGPVQARGPVAG